MQLRSFKIGFNQNTEENMRELLKKQINNRVIKKVVKIKTTKIQQQIKIKILEIFINK